MRLLNNALKVEKLIIFLAGIVKRPIRG